MQKESVSLVSSGYRTSNTHSLRPVPGRGPITTFPSAASLTFSRYKILRIVFRSSPDSFVVFRNPWAIR
jgi:hypothetical protein